MPGGSSGSRRPCRARSGRCSRAGLRKRDARGRRGRPRQRTGAERSGPRGPAGGYVVTGHFLRCQRGKRRSGIEAGLGRLDGVVGGMVAEAADQPVQRTSGPPLQARRGALGHVGEVDALGRGGDHRAGEAGAGFPQLQGQQGAPAVPEVAGHAGEAMLAEHLGGIGAEPAAQVGIAEQPLDQLGAALDLLGGLRGSRGGGGLFPHRHLPPCIRSQRNMVACVSWQRRRSAW